MSSEAYSKAEYYVGLDPSIRNTGVVVLDSKGRLVAFENGGRFADGVKGFERYLEQAAGIERFVSNNIGIGSVVHCGYEGYSYNSEHRACDMAEFGGVLKSCLLSRGFSPIYIIAPALNKAFATGNGNASKKAMMEAAALEEPELDGASDDVCDAYFLARFAAMVDGCFGRTNKELLYRRVALVKAYREDNVDGRGTDLCIRAD